MTDGLKMKYFVLSPESSDAAHAMASRQAMMTYAKCIESSDPGRAAAVRNWVQRSDPRDPHKVFNGRIENAGAAIEYTRTAATAVSPDAKPCPFCGGTDLFTYPFASPTTFAVLCQRCGASGPIAESRERAVIDWQAR